MIEQIFEVKLVVRSLREVAQEPDDVAQKVEDDLKDSLFDQVVKVTAEQVYEQTRP